MTTLPWPKHRHRSGMPDQEAMILFVSAGRLPGMAASLLCRLGKRVRNVSILDMRRYPANTQHKGIFHQWYFGSRNIG